MRNIIICGALTALMLASGAHAASEQASELALVRNTVENLLNAMVEEGLISREAAQALIAEAEAKARAEVQAMEEEQAVQPGDVRVTYVPQTVIDDISEDVTADMSEEVTERVVAQAQAEGWGVPAAVPSWLRNVRFYGDSRLRSSAVSFASDNAEGFYRNFNRINNTGGAGNLSQNQQFFNVTEDDTIYQYRFRFGAKISASDWATIGFRLATDGNNPISRNGLRGNTGGSGFGIIIDEAYINLHTPSDRDQHHLNLWAGRAPNVYESTGLIFDDDLRLDGVTVGYDQLNLAGGDGARGVFGRASAYVLQQVDQRAEQFGVEDKWLYAGQLGYEWGFDSIEAKLALSAAYYQFDNVAGVRDTSANDPLDPDAPNGFTDGSVPEYIRKGNSLFGVRNTTDFDQQIFGLASDFELVNLQGRFVKVIKPNFNLDVYADYVENIGFDETEVEARTGQFIRERNRGYRVAIELGAPDMTAWGDWALFGGWSYVERDAVVDGFSESNWLLGGTDHEGYFLGGLFGLSENTWLRLRYFSFDEIDGPRLGVDVLQFELNAKF